MHRRGANDYAWDDEDHDGEEGEWDDEEVEGDGLADDDDEPTIACPNCRKPIHEDAQRCPFCEHYISEEDRQASPQPWWVIVGTLLALAAVLSWFVF